MKNICFTIFAESIVAQDTQVWDKICEHKYILYLVFQKEICPDTKKVHIQGYCELTRSKTFTNIKNIFQCQSMHIEKRMGKQELAIAYCRKADTAIEGSQYEYGKALEGKQGTRTDIHDLMDLASDPTISLRDIKDELPVAYCKYFKAVDRVRRMEIEHEQHVNMVQSYTNCTLRPWQEELVIEITHEPNDRTIRWIVDATGNAGKTWFSKWAAVNLDAQVIANGKTRDIAHAYQNKKIVILNLARTPEEYINYTVMEQIKDGMIWSPKYESTMKYFKSPHLVVMANQWPDMTKVSLDRWHISELNKGILTKKKVPDWPIF